MTTTTRNTCTITWHGHPSLSAALDAGDALLTIHNGNCTNYIVERLSDPDNETVGYRLVKLTDYIVDRKTYDIEVLGKMWSCDCPDSIYRNPKEGCKHTRALRAALTRHGLI